ncbi:MAG: hypothetical protein ACU0CI_04695 [Shimia sp.]
MTTYVSNDVRAALDAARAKTAKRKTKLRVEVGDRYFPVLRMWKTGFAVDASDAERLRGLVDLYDGPRHLYQALIVTSEEHGGERRYEFKRNTAAADSAPLDFERVQPKAIALLGR